MSPRETGSPQARDLGEEHQGAMEAWVFIEKFMERQEEASTDKGWGRDKDGHWVRYEFTRHKPYTSSLKMRGLDELLDNIDYPRDTSL